MREEGGLQPVLCRLAGLYAVWCLHRHSALLYQGMDHPTHTPRLLYRSESNSKFYITITYSDLQYNIICRRIFH